MASARPHSFDNYGAPWATRTEEFRRSATQPSYIPPELRGELAGTPAYDAGAGLSDLSVPAPYNWDGTGDIPLELYIMGADLAMASATNIPAQNDPKGFESWLSNAWNTMTTKGEGCGIDPQAIQQAIVANAGKGPHVVAYALQQLAMTSDLCAKYFIKNPLAPPVETRDLPTGSTPLHLNTPPAKPFPWGWTLGGVSLLAVVGLGAYFIHRASKKKRRNPCSCSNPVVVEAVGYEAEERENPYGGDRGFTSIDGGEIARAAAVSPLLNPKPRKRRRARR